MDVNIKVTESITKTIAENLIQESVKMVMESELFLVVGINSTEDGGATFVSKTNMDREAFRQTLEFVLSQIPNQNG